MVLVVTEGTGPGLGRAGLVVPISVNVGPDSVTDPGFPAVIVGGGCWLLYEDTEQAADPALA